MFIKSSVAQRFLHTTNGFTFIELIVIISIFAIMSGVALFNFGGFRNSVALNNLAFDIALEIKTAQTLGVSAVEDTSRDQRQIVTVLFEDASSGSGFAETFSTFREGGISNYGSYSDASDFIIRQSDVVGGVIENIQECPSLTATSCNDLNSDVSISFRRPDPEPIMTSNDCSLALGKGYTMRHCQGSLRITLAAATDPNKKQVITVEPSGQIRVE